MTAHEIFHRSSARQKQKRFIPRNEVVGWAQGPHGLSRPVTAVVVGREMRGITTTAKGEIKINVQTYTKVTGNEGPLNFLKDAKPHEGKSGYEFEVTEDLSPKRAFELEYSQTDPITIPTGIEHILIPLVPTFLSAREGSSDTQVPHTALLAHQE